MLSGQHGGQAMPPKFGTPAYWQGRADEARALAEDMSDEDARRAMLAVAENYESIAKRSEATGTTPSPSRTTP